MTDPGVDPPDGFDEFASAQARQLLRIAFLMCNDWHDAEDLVQATLGSPVSAARPFGAPGDAIQACIFMQRSAYFCVR